MESCTVDPGPRASAALRRAIERLLASVEKAPQAHIRVEVCSSQVLVDHTAAKLSNRELEICLAIAVFHRPVSGETLAGLIFPDLDCDAALNRIKVYVHRVREKIAADFILCNRDGYCFRDGVTIDLDEFEETVHLLERCAFLSQEDRQRLHAVLNRLHGRRSASASRWDWFRVTERTIETVASRAAGLLSADAFERNAIAELLDLARLILQNDPCDEQAREIAIKAHLAAGRPTQAMSEFRHYEAFLARDLQATPSPHLRKLLQSA